MSIGPRTGGVKAEAMEPEGLSEREEHFCSLARESGYLDETAFEEAMEIRRNRLAAGEGPTKLPTILREEGFLADDRYHELRRRVLERFPKERSIGGFRIDRKVGKGGMGIVYRAIRLEDEKVVAVKVLGDHFKHDPKLVERFVREFRAISSVRHANLVEGHDAGCEDEVYYYAMEFVDGESVKERVLRDGRFEIKEAVRIAQCVARALDAIHGAGFLHRDVKSSNVLLSEEGEVKLSDLGLAMDLESDSSLTRTGTGLGSADYSSPEQLKNAAGIDGRSDIYSLGVTLFEMLAGRVPFIAGSQASLIQRKLKEDAPDVGSFRPGIPARLRDLVNAMLSRKPEERPSEPAAVLAVLDAPLSERVLRRKTTARRRLKPRKKGGAGMWIALGALGMLAALALVVFLVAR
ncbi:MAG: serine/threonine protein kinase [Planctomycetes bacterium]|nr:serine/threonine protein kinase [Planctomycetota bacterium]